MGRDNLEDDTDQQDQERIREIQEKYNPSSSNSEDDFNSSAEPESLGFIEDSDLGEEVDEIFRNIFDDLEPCKTELTNLEEELKNLKRKFKTPMELIEQSRTSDEVDNNNVITPPHKLLSNIEASTNKVRASQAVSHQANEADIKHMVCDTQGKTYQVYIPTSVLSLDQMDDDFALNNDTVLCKVREGVMTRLSVSKSDNNDISIAGQAVMRKLGLKNTDLQECIDSVENDVDGESVTVIGERVVEIIRHKKRLLTRIVFTRDERLQGTVLLSWYAATIMKIF